MAGSEAQAGFYYQNLVALQYALDLIEFGTQLRSITFENPQRAKHIDDIVIDHTHGSTFVQVKWSEDDTAAFTFHNLVTGEDGSIPLIEQLARGFKLISGEVVQREILLVSTKKAGMNRQPSKGFDYSFNEFLTEFHAPYVTCAELSDFRQVSTFGKYKSILDRLLSASGLTDFEELGHFLKCLRFRLNEPDRDTVVDRLRGRFARLGIEPSQFSTLLDNLIQWSIARKTIHTEDVLLALGLRDHFVDRLSHNFPVETQLWVQTPDVFGALDESINALDSGFLLLQGEPGSGKSTTLTMYQRQRADVNFGYYCFIPNDHTLGNERLGDDAFVRSVCIGLRNAFPGIDFPRPYAAYTLDLMNEWLHILSRQSQKVIFVVDGIDHVDRKTRQSLVAHPLTSVLDGNVPPRVLIMLSSQYVDALPPNLRQHIQSDAHRHIKMLRFGRTQVREFFRLREIGVIEENLDAAVEVSGGVPIYLEYLAEYLRGMTSYEQERFLREMPSLRGEGIDHYHQYLWDAFEADQQVINLLAVLAVREDFTTPEDIRDILVILGDQMTLTAVHEVIRKVAHVLRTSDANSVAIRHNSFREFIADRTVNLRHEINNKLVIWYEQNFHCDEAWRHRFRHLFELGEHSKVLAACNDEWLAQGWKNFRPLHEIQTNLDIAWRSAVASHDLVEFVRIGLLRQRIALIDQNLDVSDICVERLLLDIGRPQEALRCVWDGERPQCDSVSFAEYLLYHIERIGRLPPRHVIEAGLNEKPDHASPDTIRSWYRARSYVTDPVDLLQDIEKIQWTNKRLHEHLRTRAVDDKNRAFNLSIQVEVVKELAKHKKLRDLQRLRDAKSVSDTIRNAARAAIGFVLASLGEIREAEAELNGLKASDLPKDIRNCVLLKLAACGSEALSDHNDELYPHLPVPFLANGEQELNGEIVELYDQFRVLFLHDRTGYAWLETRILGLDEPIRTLIRALGLLAKIWCSYVRPTTTGISQLSLLKQVMVALDIEPQLFSSLGSRDNVALQLYKIQANRFYAAVWACAAEHLSANELLNLAEWWARSDEGKRAGFYARATRELAIAIHCRSEGALNAVVREILELAEQNARTDEETSVLVSQLVECAAAWGRCGFPVEAQRLWSEVFYIACGVDWRKDYQFNEIILPLTLAHKQDPGSTLKRLQEQVVLAHQLVGTARHQTIAFAIDNLVSFSTNISPGLALRMLIHEEPLIYRPQALHHMILELLDVEKIDLRWVLALVSTLERWDYTAYKEHCKPAMFAAYSRALRRGEEQVAQSAYSVARHIFLVEKEDVAELVHWAETWVKLGTAPPGVLQDLIDCENQKQSASKYSENAEPSDKPQWSEDLDDLAHGDFGAFEEALNSHNQEAIKQGLRNQVEHVFQDWLVAISQAIGRGLTPEDRQTLDQCFDDFVVEICSGLDSTDMKTVREALGRFIEQFAARLHTALTVESFEEYFDIDGWLNGIHYPATIRYIDDSEIAKRIQRWIETSPLLKIHLWEDFCRRRCSGQTRSFGLVAVGRRIAAREPKRAFDIIVEAWRSCSDFFFEYENPTREICADLIRLDHEKGLKFLLESFRQQYHRYPGTIVYRLDKLLEYFEEFPGCDAVRLYEVWSEYNKHLVAGLSAKPVDISWLATQNNVEFSHSCLRYLINLFNYPVVDVRRLALEELYRLTVDRRELVRAILGLWTNLNTTEKEHITSLLFSLAIAVPDFVHQWADDLVQLAHKECHYNIKVTVAEAVEAALFFGAKLKSSTIVAARELKSPPSIVRPQTKLLTARSFDRTWFPTYLRWVIERLAEITPSGELEARTRMELENLYPQLACGFQNEAEVHRRYNINSNFDRIEISGEYDKAVREAINIAVQHLVNAHAVDDDAMKDNADLLRLNDPTDLLVRRVSRPAKVQWIEEGLSDEEFVEFAAIDKLMQKYVQRDDRWVTLYEYTEQRTGDRVGSNQKRVTKVDVTIFATTQGRIRPELSEIKDETTRETIAEFRNRYRFELARVESAGHQSLLGVRVIIPLVQISCNSFRGRHSPNIASLVPGISRELGMERHSTDLLGYTLDDRQVVRSVEWQEAFDQGRRRHEPKSCGFLLEIDQELLRRWGNSRNLELWGHLVVKRATGQYGPEEHMSWQTREDVFPMILEEDNIKP